MLAYLTLIEDREDKLRFEDIYHRYYRQMILVANGVLGNMTDAEDAVQDALLRIARNISAVHDREDWAIRGYVLTIAKNSALKLRDKAKRQTRLLQEVQNRETENSSLFEQIQKSLDYDTLLRCLNRLEPLYRDILMLIYLQEMSVREVSDLLGRREDTVRKQLQRGRARLAALCTEEGMCFDNDE